jgi:tetrapyrrole methylase family protein / MazG family protein
MYNDQNRRSGMSKGFQKLVKVMERLRGEGGCPWDREQTRESLKPFLLEEAYEVLEAIEEKDVELLKEELGDLLLQVVFHAQIARERGEFAIEEVLSALTEKLVRRHPHVFGKTKAETAREVLARWEALKNQEKRNKKRKSVLDGVPKQLPALIRANQLQARAARVGFDWTDLKPVWQKVLEEMKEFEHSIKEKQPRLIQAELGDLLFALVNIARFLNVDPEEALRKTNERFTERFHSMEKKAKKSRRLLSAMSLAEMDRMWEEAKAVERRKGKRRAS